MFFLDLNYRQLISSSFALVCTFFFILQTHFQSMFSFHILLTCQVQGSHSWALALCHEREAFYRRLLWFKGNSKIRLEWCAMDVWLLLITEDGRQIEPEKLLRNVKIIAPTSNEMKMEMPVKSYIMPLNNAEKTIAPYLGLHPCSICSVIQDLHALSAGEQALWSACMCSKLKKTSHRKRNAEEVKERHNLEFPSNLESID